MSYKSLRVAAQSNPKVRQIQISYKRTVLFIMVIFPFLITGQIDFVNVTDGPVLHLGSSGEWDEGQVWNPSVVKDGDTLKMWYTGANDNVMNGPACKIGYAWSLQGIAWNKYEGNPVLSAEMEWEGESIYGCAVLKDGDTLKMWYGTSTDPYLISQKIGYATSLDGIIWDKHPMPVLQTGPESDWDDALIAPTTVIKDENIYKMWYWAGRQGFPWVESIPQTGMATSIDGIEWIKYDDPVTTEFPYASSDPVLKRGLYLKWDEHRAIDPMVVKSNYGYEMWYIGFSWNTNEEDLLGYATSEDGITWNKYTGNPIFTEPLLWGHDIYGGTVLLYDDAYRMWFSCFHSYAIPPAQPQIGYAYDGTVSVQEFNQVKLHVQVHPCPFTTTTTISYELQQSDKVILKIYNHLGQLIYRAEENQPQGKQQLIWNAENYADGIFYYRLQVGAAVANGKMVKVR